MKTIVKNLVLFLSLIFIAASCSKDDDNNGGGGNSGSRLVKYEITGNFRSSRTIQATYQPANPGQVTEQINSDALPWIKEFTAAPNATIAAIGVVAFRGTPGQTLTIRIYIGGELKREVIATANSNGDIDSTPISYNY